MLGTNTNEKITRPNCNNNPAPGQCVISNNTPNDVKENDSAPVMNANFFMLVNFKFLICLAFKFRPVILSDFWSSLFAYAFILIFAKGMVTTSPFGFRTFILSM